MIAEINSNPHEESINPEPLDYEFDLEGLGFTGETLEKIDELLDVLPSLDIFETDLREIYRVKLVTLKNRVSDVMASCEMVAQERGEFNSKLNMTEFSHTSSDNWELLKPRVTDIKSLITERLREDSSRFDEQGKPIKKLEKIFSDWTGLMLGFETYKRDSMYHEGHRLSFDSPLRGVIYELREKVIPDPLDIDNLSLDELLDIRSRVIFNLESGEDYKDFVEVDIRTICDEFKVSETVKLYLINQVRSVIDNNLSLLRSKTLMDINKRINVIRLDLENREENLATDLDASFEEVVNFVREFIYPRGSSSMPEGVWWTEEVLVLFLYAYGSLKKLENQFSNDISERLKDKIKKFISKIEDIIKNIHYQLIDREEKLDLANSEDVVYHSSSDLDVIINILTGGLIKSLGSLRQEHGDDFERSTDNLNGGKKHEQEIHQIYFNNLGKDETYPEGYTRNPYSPIKVSLRSVKDNPEVMAVLQEELLKVKQRRLQFAKNIGNPAQTLSDNSRFLEQSFMGDDENVGLDRVPESFYISTGFFFMKRNLLQNRLFMPDDGIAVFDSDYSSNTGTEYLEVNWQEEGCFVTDRLGWVVIKSYLRANFEEAGLAESDLELSLQRIEENTVIVDGDSWGGSFSNTRSIFTDQSPVIQLADGSLVGGEEVSFIGMNGDSAKYRERRKLFENEGVFRKYNEVLRLSVSGARADITNHLKREDELSDHSVSATRIIPTLKLGDLPNAAGASPEGSLYRMVSE